MIEKPYGPFNNWELAAVTLLAVAWLSPYFTTALAQWWWHLNGVAAVVGLIGIYQHT